MDSKVAPLPHITPPPKGCELLRENVFEEENEECNDPELLKRRQPTMLRKGDALIGPLPKEKRYTVVFDLDETVVYARDGPLYARAYLKELFRAINKYFEVVVWTAGERDYAKTILEEINEDHIIRYLIYRDEKWFDEEDYTKDLRQLGRDLDYTIIIENTPDCIRANPRNGIIVEDFEVLQPEDSMLSFFSTGSLALPPLERPSTRGRAADAMSALADGNGESMVTMPLMPPRPTADEDEDEDEYEDERPATPELLIPRRADQKGGADGPPPLQSIEVVPQQKGAPKEFRRRRFGLGRKRSSHHDDAALDALPGTPSDFMLTDVATVTSVGDTTTLSQTTIGGTRRELTDRTLKLLQEVLIALAKSKKTVPVFLEKCPLLTQQTVEGCDGNPIPIFHLGTRRRRRDAGSPRKKLVKENKDKLPKINKRDTDTPTAPVTPSPENEEKKKQ